jgi:transglutaminase-like putative cysteine protease
MTSSIGAALTALGVFLAAWPLTTLFDGPTWLQPSALALTVIVVVGIVLRRRALPAWLVVTVQALATCWTLVLLTAADTTVYLLPTPDTAALLAERFAEALDTITRYAAPAPSSEGIELALTAVIALAGLAADALAQTFRSPAASGIPMLGLYLTAAASSNGPLHPVLFLAPAAVWAASVARSGRLRVRRWSTTVATRRGAYATPEDQDTIVAEVADSARRTGTLVLVGALVAAALLPHLPTRYLIDGLGRGGIGGPGAGGTVGLSSTLDVSRSLSAGSDGVVLQFRTDAPQPAPLKVSVATRYDGGQWIADDPATQTDLVPGPFDTPPGPARWWVPRTVQISDNTLPRPLLPVPSGARTISGPGDRWRWVAGTGEARALVDMPSYEVAYDDLADLSATDLAAVGGPTVRTDGVLGLDEATRSEFSALAESIVPPGSSRYAAAVAIQQYLRSTGGFTYTLALSAADPGESPERAFLRTKRGYCVQFATAMIFLAQTEGIDARMVIGFLPGPKENGTYAVRGQDAHAWPELYFDELGWVRFEPTPGARSGVAPAWTGADVTPSPSTTTPSTATAPSRTERTSGTPGTSSPRQTTVLDTMRAFLTGSGGKVIGVVLVLALLTQILPITADLVRRRRRRAAANEAALVEERWRELTSALGDLGLPPESGTLRQVAEHYVRVGHLDERATLALDEVVRSVEVVRYAPSGPAGDPTTLDDDLSQVLARARRTRRRRDRIRAALWPADGRRWWGGGIERLSAGMAGAAGRLAAVIQRRRPRHRHDDVAAGIDSDTVFTPPQ